MKKQTEAAIGWGMRVGGPRPYLTYQFHGTKDDVELTDPSYHRAVRVAIVPLAAARKAGLLRKLDGGR